jgi:amino acid adenylation domain-containing protein
MGHASVIDSFAVQATRRSHAPAVVTPSDVTTYAQLAELAARLRRHLVEHDSRDGGVVATYLRNGPDYVAAILAAGEQGWRFVPLEREWPAARTREVLRHAAPDILVTDPDGRAKIAAELEAEPMGLVVLTIAGTHEGLAIHDLARGRLTPRLDAVRSGPPPGARRRTSGDGYYVLPTSGTTGVPKMIEGRHASLAHFIDWETREFGLDETVRVLALAPVSFDVSLRDLFVPLATGGTLYVPNDAMRRHPVLLLEWLAKNRITLMHAVPSVLRVLAETCRTVSACAGALRSLRVLLSAGEALYGADVAALRPLLASSAEIVNLYGPTETTLAKLFHRVSGPIEASAVVPLGRPIPGASVSVRDGDLLVAPGEVGEICIETPFATNGFFNDELLTREKFQTTGGPGGEIRYRTGDLGSFSAEGVLAYHGRIDHQVKLHGNRVELVEVERNVAAWPGVDQAVVVVDRSGTSAAHLGCFYTSRAVTPPPTEGELMARAAASLPLYMRPSYFERLEAFPLRMNGKIDRDALIQIKAARPTDFAPPVGPVEEKLERYWTELLGIARAGRQASFVALGGSSLNAMRLIARIYHDFGVVLNVSDIFESSTLAAIADLVERRSASAPRDAAGLPPVTPATRTDEAPLSSFQLSVWEVSQYEPAAIAYTESVAYDVGPLLDLELCERVLQALVERHEILRTAFSERDGRPVQSVQPMEAKRYTIERVDLRGSHAWRDDATRHLQDQTQEGFAISEPPLFHCSIFALPHGRSLLTVCVSHIIVDMGTVRVLASEAKALYAAYRERRVPALAPLKSSYQEFARAQVTALQRGELAAAAEYWRNVLRPPLPQLTLSSRPRPLPKAYDGALCVAHMTPDLANSVRGHAAKHKVSVFTYFLASFFCLLHERTGERDLVIGVPITVRDQWQLEDVPGNFLNVVPIRATVEPGRLDARVLRQTQAALLDGIEHGRYPFRNMLSDIGYKAQLTRAPVFDVTLTFIEAAPGDAETLDALVHLDKSTSKYDASVFVYERLGTFEVLFEYSTSILTASEAQALLDRYVEQITLQVTGDQGS